MKEVQQVEVQNQNLYYATLRLSILWGTWKNFCSKVVRHPSAMVGGVLVLLFILMALFAPVLAPYGPEEGALENRLLAPAWYEGGDPAHLLGGDELGRDILSRIIYGVRVSLLVGLITVGISVGIGIILGVLAGYYRGWFDNVMSRFADLLLAFPFLIFAIGMMAATGPGFGNLILALTFKGWVEFFRLVRGEMLSEKTREYVEAAKITGQSDLAIMVSEVLPNIIHSIIVLATLRMGFMIIMEASLSYLGLGIQDQAAWGSMIKAGKDYMMNAWWISTFPGLFLLTLVLAINMLGEGLRDILDPRLRTDH